MLIKVYSLFQASETTILVVVKVSVVLCGLMGAGLALTTRSIYLLWMVGADVVYSMLTPQVICTFFLSQCVNEYGACSGFVLAIVLRALVGEPAIGLPDVLPLPWDKIQEDGHRYRLFPFRTAIMLITTGAILLVLHLAVWLSEKRLLKRKSDAKKDTNMHHMAPVQTEVEENERLNKEQSRLSSQGSKEEEEKC